MTDRYEQPAHYHLVSGVETWDVIEAVVRTPGIPPEVGYHLGEVLRYVTRAGRKKGPENLRKDLQKARACLDRALLLLATGEP